MVGITSVKGRRSMTTPTTHTVTVLTLQDARSCAKDIIPKLQPRDECRFMIPLGALGRRVMYQEINQTCMKKLGKGCYRVISEADGAVRVVAVKGVPESEQPPKGHRSCVAWNLGLKKADIEARWSL